MTRLAILGASGHGKVVADCAELAGWDEIVFFDDAWPRKTVNSHWEIIGNSESLLEKAKEFDGVLVAIGDNKVREDKLQALSGLGATIPVVIHPFAIVSRFASIGAGSVVIAGAVVNADCRIGKGAIINTGSTVGHDCVIGDFVHVCPGANLAGGACVGDRSWVGIGSSVRQLVRIGCDVMVGAGSAVVSDIPDACVVTGVPARVR